MNRSILRLLTVLLAGSALFLASCGDGERSVDPTAEGIGDNDETSATVPDDDDGAIGEPSDEDSQSDTVDVEPSEDNVVPTSSKARVVGDFGEEDIDLLLTEDSACTIRQPTEADEAPVAEVHGTTTEGATFALDWSVDAGRLSVTLERNGSTWTVERDLDGLDQQIIRLTRNGELLVDTTFRSDSGDEREAFLYVNCQPVT